MKTVVEQVHTNSIYPPVIAINEVGNLKSAETLDCGMAFEESTNKPILKIFNQHGGTVEEEDTSKRDNVKQYIVLRNKKTNKVTIYGTKTVYLKKPDYFKSKTLKKGESTAMTEEFVSTFGTKKATRLYKARDIDAIEASEDVFNNISTSSDVLLTSALSPINEFTKYLPLGCNRFATNIESVYPVSTLLTENEIQLMTDYAQEVISMLPVPVENEDLSQFFIANVNRLAQKNVQNICLLTFADGLVNLLFTKPNELDSRNCDIYPNCSLINEKLLDHFTDYSATGRDLSSKMKDKAICHIIILMLLINMNTINLSWISTFLPSKCQKRLITLMRVVGAMATKEDKTKFTLKIPLSSLPTFQKTSKRKR